MNDNTEEENPLTPEEIQAAFDNFDKYQAEKEEGTGSKNLDMTLEAKKKQDEEKKLQSEFKKFVDEMPRRTKRNLFPQKKFGNVIMDRFRQQRVTSQKHK